LDRRTDIVDCKTQPVLHKGRQRLKLRVIISGVNVEFVWSSGTLASDLLFLSDSSVANRPRFIYLFILCTYLLSHQLTCSLAYSIYLYFNLFTRLIVYVYLFIYSFIHVYIRFASSSVHLTASKPSPLFISWSASSGHRPSMTSENVTS